MSTRFLAIALLFFSLHCVSLYAQFDGVAYSDLEQQYVPPEPSTPTPEQLENVMQIDSILQASADQPARTYRYHSDGVIPCDCEECVANPKDSFWYAGLELTMLSPTVDTTVFGLGEDAGGVGPRITFGWESAKGFGVRTRFWGMANDADVISYTLGPTPLDLGINTARFDFDLYRRFGDEDGSLLFGAGLSSAQLEYEMTDVVVLDTMKNTGAGVSVFAEGRHRFYNSIKNEWAVLSRGRWAYMVGEEETNLFPGVVFDSNLNVAEAAFGIEYKHKMRRATFVAHYLMEVQSWTPSEIEGVNFLGSTAGVGFTW